MQPRQNKKTRKGRNNPNNRERTVTTLTEDPNSSYLVPKSSEEPPNSALMASYNVPHNQQAQLNNPNNVINQYQMQAATGNFGYGYNAFGIGPSTAAMHQQPQPFYTTPQGVPIPGNNDLEVLQNLKQMILDGQHPIFRATPQPAALARLYLGPNAEASSSSQVLLHPDQSSATMMPRDGGQMQHSNSSGSNMPSPAVSGPMSPDVSRRPPRMQNKEGWDPSGARKPPQAQPQSQQAQSVNNAMGQEPLNTRNMLSSLNTTNLSSTGASRGSSVPPSATVKAEPGDHLSPLKPVHESPAGRGKYDGPPSARSPRGPIDHREPHSYNRPPPNEVSPVKGYYDGKEDMAVMEARRRMPPPPDDRRYGHPYDDRDRDRDRALPPRMNSSAAAAAAADMGMNIDRGPVPAADDRHDRDRERDRYRYRDWPERDRERDYRAPPPGSYDRYSRPQYSSDPRRPQEYERKRYEPELADTSRRMADARGPPPPSTDIHVQSVTVPPVDDHARDRSSAAPSVTARGLPPPPADSPRGPPPNSGSTVPPTTPSDALVSNVPSRSSTVDEHGRSVAPSHRGSEVPAVRPPGSTISIASSPSEQSRDHRAPEDRARSQVSLEERISRTPLQDRLAGSGSGGSQQQVSPAPSRSDHEHHPRLEDRLAPSGASSQDGHRAPTVVERGPSVARTVGPADERDSRQSHAPSDSASAAVQDSRPHPDDRDRSARPMESRYTRPITPLPNEAAVPPMHRTSYPAPPPRSASVVRDDRVKPPSPSARPPPSRDFRAREPSRERHEPPRGSYVRPYEERRPDAMDVDVPARYPDTTASYRRPYSPPPPPPSAEARDRDRARAASTYPPSPRTTAEPVYDDRRYPAPSSAPREWYPPYDKRSRDWSQVEEDAYWKTRGYPPLAERERYERDVPPSSRAWERPAERDPREYPPPPPRVPSPPRTYDRAPSSYPPPAVLPADDRSYPVSSREIDRTRGGPPPPAYAGRVRARSPSPIRRPPPIDDSRPPMKRAREDYPPAEYSYPPSRDPARRPDYPHRPGSPMGPPPSGGGYYERPPPSNGGAGPDRDYPPRDRGAYPPPPVGYERPRSPGPSSRAPANYNRASYSRPPDPRDRDYMPPPPRPT